jgi:hypothetical protein
MKDPIVLQPGQSALFDRKVVEEAVNRWLRIGAVSLSLEWWEPRPTVRLDSGPLSALFGALALQLLQAVARSDGLALCSACGRPYTPERRPDPNRRHYCPQCRNAAPHRDAVRSWRAKQRQTRRSTENG